VDRDAGISRAYRAFAQGRRQEAVSALRQILRSAPDDPAALTLLGRMSLADNEPLLALQAFERVLRAHGDAATAWLDLARTLRELNNHAQALTAAHRAIDIDARRAGGWLLLGDLHLDLGDLAAARTAFLRARVLEPANVGALRGLARCDAPDPDDALTARMLELVDAPATPERDRALLHYALAQVYRQAGLAEPFQQHLLQANRIQRSFTPGTREDYAAVFDRIEACLDAQALDRLPAASPGMPVPLFILGMPRSGTSLVEQLMAADPGVVAGGEINYARGPLVRAVEQRTGRAFPDGVGELSEADMQALSAGFTRRLAALAGGKPIVTDKTPGNFHLLGLLVRLFPTARIIHVSRDPLDTCFSILQQPFSEASPHTCDTGLLAYVYARYRRLMRHWETWRADAFITVRYEDLVARPGPEGRRLFEYCGLAWQDDYLDEARRKGAVRTFSASQVRQPIHRRSVGSSDAYPAMLAPLREALERGLEHE
jgi:tetratricopeptide (TPR) repeat protein